MHTLPSSRPGLRWCHDSAILLRNAGSPAVVGGGNVDAMGSGDSLGRTLFIATVTFAVIIFGVWVAIHQRQDEPLQLAVVSEKSGDIPLPDDEMPLEAVLVEDDVKDGSS